MKFAVYGSTGQLARALKTVFANNGCDGIFFDRTDCDLSQDREIIYKHAKTVPDVDGVIIAAAYTAVDAAETDKANAFAVNEDAPRAIAEACKERGHPLVFISTDYVFNGTVTEPYTVVTPTQALNVYGASKLAGENALRDVGGNTVILRTSWVYDGTGKNFLTTMLRLGKVITSLSVVSDQIGRPTYAGHLAKAVYAAALKVHSAEISGVKTYHISGTGMPTSWAGFARAIFIAAQDDLPHSVEVNDITTEEYPTPAARPSYSVLDVTDFETTFDYSIPDWKEGLVEALAEWRNFSVP